MIIIGKFHILLTSIQLQTYGLPWALATTLHYAYQCHLSCPGKTQVHITSHFSLLPRLRYNLSIFGEGEKVSMGGLGIISRGDPSLHLHGNTSTHSVDCGIPVFPASCTLLLSMIRQAVWYLLMKYRKSCSVKRTGTWRAFYQCRMPCCSITACSFIRLEFGQRVNSAL